MKCPKCGFEVSSSLKFCPACGEALKKVQKQKTLFWVPGESDLPQASGGFPPSPGGFPPSPPSPPQPSAPVNISQSDNNQAAHFPSLPVDSTPEHHPIDASQPLVFKTPAEGLKVPDVFQQNSFSAPTQPISTGGFVENQNNNPTVSSPGANYDFNKPVIFDSGSDSSNKWLWISLFLVIVSAAGIAVYFFKDSLF